MVELPSGTVTFLFTDLEGSTRLWEEQRAEMQSAISLHDAILQDVVEAHDGIVLSEMGDGIAAVFVSAREAVGAALDAQLRLVNQDPNGAGSLRARMGLHAAEAELRADGRYVNVPLNRCARLMASAHGGQVLVSESVEALVRDVLPPNAGLVSLGVHRLRDLTEPIGVFQLTHPGLPTDFAPLRTVDAVRGNLPEQLTSFVGREGERAALVGLLESSRVVTVTGVGGVGKTRLALQVAGDLGARFRDGVWLCELAAAGDADAMVELIAATLGVVQRPVVTREASVLEFLRPKELLLVLDNCEHVLDAAGRLVEELLQHCPSVRVLATSREGLAIAGEQLWQLRSLSVPSPSASTDVATALHSDAVRLFVDRASAARRGFELDDTNVGAVAEICRRLDGVPLAIELAAVRVVSMTPQEIAGLLDERFRLLAGGRRSSVERHQTLRATVEWSYSLLDGTERVVFDRLGVFAGAFDADAAVAIGTNDATDAWGVRDALASLVTKSMVNVDDTASDSSGYVMLETLRQFALERLSAEDDVDAVRRRHAEHYVGVAELMGPALMGPDELVWRPRFRAALDNLRAAFTWALDSPAEGDEHLAVQIVAHLADQAPHDQAAGLGAWAERAVDAAERSTPGLRTAVLGAATSSAMYRGDVESQLSFGARALRDGIPSDCPAPSPAIMFAVLGTDVDDLQTLVDAATRLEEIGAPAYNLTHVIASQALIAARLGLRPEANAAAARAVEWARLVDNPTGLAVSLPMLAAARFDEAPDDALAAVEESIALTRAGASDGMYGFALMIAAELLAPHDRARALGYWRDAFRDFQAVGALLDLVASVWGGSRTLTKLGEEEVAATLVGIWASLDLLHWVVPMDEVVPSDTLRATLGDERYEAAVARGSAFTLDEAVAYIGDELERLCA
ncbi:MAG TPA: adenylate/guanylate cyclase domain-containing protein, partial [Acidimicrobiia bacterium]|nr:adenylate/guanylate cyclase domain-containing protein [Acidimicrobiia bacterium]